jgi:hypothetical protein
MAFETWEDVADALLRALDRLLHGEFLILGEPTADPFNRRGLFGRRARPTTSRYVQVLKLEELFTAECVGAESLGGTWSMDTTTIAHLRGLGWRGPDDLERPLDDATANFDMYVAPDAVPTMVELLVATLRALGAQPHGLELTTSD